MERRLSPVKVRVVCFLLAIFFLASHVSAQSAPTAGISVVYTDSPANITSSTNATFAFTVVDGNGTNPCAAVQSCSFTCQVGHSFIRSIFTFTDSTQEFGLRLSFIAQLDQSPSFDCVTGNASFSNLQDGVHNFSVAVNSSSGAAGASRFRWTIGKHKVNPSIVEFCEHEYSPVTEAFFVFDRQRHLNILFADTVAPTAVVVAGAAFTNAQNVTVNITFSEICEHDGGFVCTNSSFCEVSCTTSPSQNANPNFIVLPVRTEITH